MTFYGGEHEVVGRRARQKGKILSARDVAGPGSGRRSRNCTESPSTEVIGQELIRVATFLVRMSK